MAEPEGARVQVGPGRRATLTHATRQVREALRVLAGTPRVLRLVWDAHPGFALLLLAIGLAQGLVPLVEMWIFKHLVDAVAASVVPAGSAAGAAGSGVAPHRHDAAAHLGAARRDQPGVDAGRAAHVPAAARAGRGRAR